MGLVASEAGADFPSPSGFYLGGPSDRRQGQNRANALQAIYPNFMTDEHAALAKSLDFEGPGQERGPK